MAAAIHTDVPALLKDAALGLDVDDAGRSQAILGGQCARDKLDRVRQARAQPAVLSKQAHAFRQRHPVDAVLNVRVLVADVDRALGGGVLRDSGRLQQDLAQASVVTARLVLDYLLGNLVG